MDWELISINRTKETETPVFKQIADLLLRNIELGLLKPGEKLPTEREVSLRCGVARGTAKNAFKQLEKDKIIETIQGSGSYVRKGQGALEYRQKKEALELIAATIKKIRAMDVSDQEIFDLFQTYLNSASDNTIRIAIVDNNLEAMLNLSNQLSSLFPHISLSILILESVTMTIGPEHLFDSFDFIIVDSAHYLDLLRLSPGSHEKIVETVISPAQSTLVAITALNRDSRIGIICRTNAFLQSTKDLLLSFQFRPENIQSFFEMDYTTNTYFPGGIDALIAFSDAHIFINDEFESRNEALLAKGGKLIQFEYQIQQGSLIYIKNKISALLSE